MKSTSPPRRLFGRKPRIRRIDFDHAVQVLISSRGKNLTRTQAVATICSAILRHYK